MSWFKKEGFDSGEVIGRTGFLVSLVAYVVFWGADLIKPGFVSNYMTVHWFLFALIGFGILWSVQLKRVRDHLYWQFGIAAVVGIILAIATWKTGRNLAEFRILVSFIALVLPTIMLGVLRSGSK